MAELDQLAASLLSPEELEAIQVGEYSDDEIEALKAIASEDEDGEEGGDDGQESVDGESSDAGSDAAVENEATVEDREDDKFSPTYLAQLPSDYDAQLNALKQELSTLAEKFKQGDIDFEEYQASTDQLADRRDALTSLRTKSEISREMQEQGAEQEWQWTIRRFVAKIARDEKIDYQSDEAMRNDLDAFVRVLAAHPDNAKRDGDWFLNEAHRRVKALHGIDQKISPPSKQETAASRRPKLEAVPKTLAMVPGSDGPGDIGDEFADIDKLDGVALERAIARMSPQQREKYARAG
jgi:hypothetical protein